MIRISDIKMPLDYTDDKLKDICASQLKMSHENISDIYLVRKGVDARRKNDVHFSLTVDVKVRGNENSVLSRLRSKNVSISQIKDYIMPGEYNKAKRPVVVGLGPAGLFCAYILALCNARPLILERGSDVDRRKKATDLMRNSGILDEECNIQFGEGGAGTFSDGKLNTGIKDMRIRKVLKTFAENGAPSEILYSSKPHIGTDKLSVTVKNIRRKIEEAGGEVLFNSRLTDIIIKDNCVKGIEYVKDGKKHTEECDELILAIGHSARDTFEMLKGKSVIMEAKPFSVGARIEHLRTDIDKAQYGLFAGNEHLGAADYKLSAHMRDNRGVYTFCMCPGGYVMPASSEKDMIATNGMSEFARDGVNSNSAVLVGVTPSDFGSDDVLSGIYFQRKIEKAAFLLGGGEYKAPIQLVGDFLKGKKSDTLGDILPSYTPGTTLSDIHLCLPDFVTQAMSYGITEFSRRLNGFNRYDALLTAPETRSSSPVRILRGEDMQSINIKGLYPCGEGAGYAGGITSSAVDGIKCAEKIIGFKG